jgi:polysaccharide biosynthesis/export protein
MNKLVMLPVLFLLQFGTVFMRPSAAQEPEKLSQNTDAEYVIGLEDVLNINVWKEAELSLKDVVVRPDGKISVPLVGDILADGLTVRQLQDSLGEKLKDYVKTPLVTVTVIKVVSKSAALMGQVAKPGVYSLGSPTTVMELLARAGGFTQDAKPKKIKIIRSENGKSITIPFNYNDIIGGKNLQQNILLKNGDIVAVP